MKYCCNYFPKIAIRFAWFSYLDGKGGKVFLMPCLYDNEEQRIRVNHCPVCGADVRSIEIPENDFSEMFTSTEKTQP